MDSLHFHIATYMPLNAFNFNEYSIVSLPQNEVDGHFNTIRSLLNYELSQHGEMSYLSKNSNNAIEAYTIENNGSFKQIMFLM